MRLGLFVKNAFNVSKCIEKVATIAFNVSRQPYLSKALLQEKYNFIPNLSFARNVFISCFEGHSKKCSEENDCCGEDYIYINFRLFGERF